MADDLGPHDWNHEDRLRYLDPGHVDPHWTDWLPAASLAVFLLGVLLGVLHITGVI